MSSKKDKLIEDAQRFALRGQLDKAIKSYQQVVALDPSAINQRQRLAELLVKAGRIEDARSEFAAIGKYFSSNGYYLKAIAVYKKLQVMFPGDIDITLTLADLNEKHGLAANALAEYKQVFDYYEKNAESAEALKILEKMHTVDQQNVGIKLKLAEAYFQADRKDQSYTLFGRLASMLQERGDSMGLSKLNSRMQQLFPDKSEFMYDVLAEQVRGDADSTLNAISGVQALLRNNPQDKRVWDLIIEAYQRLHQPQRVKLAYQHYLKFFPDDLVAQTGLIECVIAEKDLAGAFQLLDQYEQHFVESAAFHDLLRVYQALDLVDPINIRILQGLRRAFVLVGDDDAAAAMGHKIESLQSISGKYATQPATSDADGVSRQEYEPFAENEADQAESTLAGDQELVRLEGDAQPERPDAFDFSEPEEFEIEIELDEDESPFATLPQEGTATEAAEDAWLNSVDDVFDSTATSPRSVKFGDDVDISDAQSHYDLGVAFKEMGLFDEAISEFRQAADDPARRTACLILQATCLCEKGNLEAAESLLRSLLKPGLGREDGCSVKYELALICEAAGKSGEAAELLAEIDDDIPGFRDVRTRLDSSSGEELSLDFSDEELKGFDLK